MNRKRFWVIFAVVQAVGTAGLFTGSPHGFAIGLVVAMILLFPGSVLMLFVLGLLGVGMDYATILMVALPINLVSWYLMASVIRAIRSRKST